MHEEEVDPLGWRICASVVRGEIDSREQNRVTGRIWLIDRKFPIELTLRGNPLRDIAGCLLEFENPNPMPEDNEGLCPIQMGVTRNITASRKVRLLDISAQGQGPLPTTLSETRKIANAIWIEWFSNANGRVIIHASDFMISISDFTWRMSRDQEQEQIKSNQKAHSRWAEIVALENGEDDDLSGDSESNDNWHMNEFEWERQFQESDAISQRYMLLMETFIDAPDRDQVIAHEMGWNWSDSDEFEEDEFNVLEDGDAIWDEIDDLSTQLQPIAETEGVDWVQAPDGSVRHPLSLRVSDVMHKIWVTCQEHTDSSEQEANSNIQAMLFHAQTLNAKIAGALDSLAYDREPDGGFIVACLKRSLRAFDLTMKSMGSVAKQNTIPSKQLTIFKDELFTIRQEILRLMQRYRNQNQHE
jgi:hypothetical protein